MSSLRRAETSNLDSAFALVEIHGEGLVHVILALCSLSMMVVARGQVCRWSRSSRGEQDKIPQPYLFHSRLRSQIQIHTSKKQVDYKA